MQVFRAIKVKPTLFCLKLRVETRPVAQLQVEVLLEFKHNEGLQHDTPNQQQ
jgi:hypothetical protein